ncbi:MAG: beta-mannosidase [Oscillospiraceae bacterium]|nr:beta-mannosidase [Oscillospiraceae bacterium]
MNKIERLTRISAIAVLIFAVLTGCDTGGEPAPTVDEPPTTETEDVNMTETSQEELVQLPPREPVELRYEAADAELFGNVRLSGDYLEGFEQDDDYCAFTVEIPYSGFYDLEFVSVGIGGAKDNYVSVNGERIGDAHTTADGSVPALVSRVYLEAGSNTVEFQKHWGWVRLETLIITDSAPIDTTIYNVSAKLVNPNANETTRRLMSYLADSYGSVILSGQYSDMGIFGEEPGVIFFETGKRPAVLGLDMMDYTPSRAARGTSSRAVEHAIEMDAQGGIVTFCWHWNAPDKYLRPNGTWYRGFYTDETRGMDLAKIMNGDEPESYDLLMADIDAIAVQLKILQDADVPVLWRPLHEAAGRWFWWGAAGPEAQKQLWITMYEKLTFEHGLNNLIWLWNGQDTDWYPGDEYVDIIGEDIYPGERVYSSQANKFIEAVNYADTPKIVVLSENSVIFDPDLALRDGAMWGFWATWSGDFVLRTPALRYSEQYTEKEMLLKAYNHELVVTLEDLPDLKNYPIRD